MAWFKDNLIQILLIVFGITFGYANFTKEIEVNARDIKSLDLRTNSIEEKLDKALILLERIDERTQKDRR